MICQPNAIQAQLDEIADSVYLSAVVVTAQYVPTESRETVSSVRILEKESMESRGATSLLDLLQTEPNIRVSYDPILGSGITINGLPADNVMILQDGVPVVGRLNGAVDVNQLRLGSVNRIEIIEGAQSLMFGSSASAGVINLLSSSGQVYKWEGGIQSVFEGNGFRTYEGDIGVNLGDFNVNAFGGGSFFRPEEDTSTRAQTWNPRDQYYGRLGVTFAPGEQLNIRATGNYFKEYVDNLGEVRRPQFKPYAFDDIYKTERIDGSIIGKGWAGSQYYWQGTLAYNVFDRVKNSYRIDFEDGSEDILDGAQDTSRSTGVLFRGSLASSHADRNWNFLIGGDYYRETIEDNRILDSAQNTIGEAAVADVGLYGSVQFEFWEALKVQAGTRFAHNSRYGAALTPAVWMAWHGNNMWSAKLSYANGFRSPGLKELYFNFVDANHFIVGNPDLDPEKSHNIRVEVDKKFIANGMWNCGIKLQGFYNNITNRIILSEYEELKYTYNNLDKWSTTGGGMTFSVSKSSLLSINSALVLTGYYNTISTEQDVPAMSMSPDLSNDITFHFFKNRLHATVWHKWTGATPFFYLEDDETLLGERSGWNLLNFSLSSNLWDDRIALTIGVKNILDEREVDVTGGIGGTHGGSAATRPVHWGRSFFVRAAFRLHSRS